MNLRVLRNPGFVTALLVLALSGAGIKAGNERYNIYLQKKPIYPEAIGDLQPLLQNLPVATARWVREGVDYLEKADNLEL